MVATRIITDNPTQCEAGPRSVVQRDFTDVSSAHMADHASEAMALFERGLRCVYSNAAFDRLGGFVQSEAVGLSFEQLAARVAFLKQAKRHIEAALATCEEQAVDTESVVAGLMEPVLVRVVTVPDPERASRYALVVATMAPVGVATEPTVQDDTKRMTADIRTQADVEALQSTDVDGLKRLIVERTAALEVLRESEERYRGLFENSTTGMYRSLPDGKLQMVNPALAEMLGFDSPSELMSFRDVGASEGSFAEGYSREAFIAEIEATGRVCGLETVWLKRDGTPIHVRESAAAIRDANGVTLHYEGTVEDVTERRRIEMTVRENEARLHLLAENSTDVVSRQMPDGKYVYVSPSILNTSGYAPEDLLGRYPAEFFHPDDLPILKVSFQALLRGDGGERDTARFRCKDGEYIWVEITRRVIRDEAGDAQEIQASTRDVSERVRVENALRESEARFRALIENGTDLVMLLRPDGYITYVGPSVKSVLGYEPDETVGKNCLGWVHPGDKETYHASVKELLCQPNGTLSRMIRVLHRDGEWKVIEITAHNMIDTPGVNAIAAIARDVTDRCAAEETIRENEARFRGAFDEAPIGMALQDVDGRYLRVNPALCRMTGFTEQDLLSMSFRDLVHPDDLRREEEYRRLMLEGAEPSNHSEKRCRRADGTWMWTLVSTSPVRGENNTPLYFVVQFQDVTEARAAEDALRESESRFRHLWHMVADGIRLMDENGIVLMVNDAFCRIIGKTADQIVGRSYLEMYDDQYHASSDGVLQYRLQHAAIEPFLERDITLWDGRFVHFEVSNTVLDSEGHRPSILSSFRDTTEKRKAQETLERYRVLAEHANDIMLFIRLDGTIIEANDAAARAYGYTREELSRMTVDDVRAPGTEDPVAVPKGKTHVSPIVAESKHRRKDGSVFPVEVSVQSTLIGNESILLSVIRDTTERTAFAQELAHQAFHDPLTQLPNRALFLDRLGHALASAQRRNDKVAVLFLDLDRFKTINDSLGHQAGDQLLVSAAARVRSCIRSSDTAARFGGDEFTILLEGITSESEAICTAERVLRRLQTPYEVDGNEVFISGSIGVAVGCGSDNTADELLREADAAMYQAKSTGKARYALFRRDMATGGKERLQLESDLRRAIERGEFQVYYQPIVLMDSQRTIAVEALARWQHPRFGLMSPDEFVPLQEQIGLIAPFTMWMLRQAQEQCLRWKQKGIRLGVSVNVSVHNLHEEGFAAKVGAVLAETGMSPNSLKLEITESAVMMDPVRALAILNDIAAMGVRLSIDDFGTGYSSLTYLKQMPVHEIKIDKSFVLGMDSRDDDDAAIVRATIDLAHNLRKKVVAEGVETESVWNLLNLLGCDAAQGFYMARPMPVEQFDKWLATSRFGLGREPKAPLPRHRP